MRQEAVAISYAIVAFVLGAVAAIPAIRVVRKEDDRRSYSLSSASTDHCAAHLWTDVFATSRMRTLLGPSRASKSLHRTVSISDTLMSARRHARVGLRTARCATRDTLLADGVTMFDPRTRGSRTTSPVRACWPVIRECLPSCKESASRNPQAESTRT